MAILGVSASLVPLVPSGSGLGLLCSPPSLVSCSHRPYAWHPCRCADLLSLAAGAGPVAGTLTSAGQAVKARRGGVHYKPLLPKATVLNS